MFADIYFVMSLYNLITIFYKQLCSNYQKDNLDIIKIIVINISGPSHCMPIWFLTYKHF